MSGEDSQSDAPAHLPCRMSGGHGAGHTRCASSRCHGACDVMAMIAELCIRISRDGPPS